MSSPGFSIHVTVTVAPENVDKFLEEFKKVLAPVTKEPESLFFEMYQDPENPGVLSWVENWSKSPEWFMEHQMTKEYYKEYFKVTEPMFIAPREFKIKTRIGAPFLAAKKENFE